MNAHWFTGTYDGWAGDCVNCEVGPYEVINELVTTAEKVLPVLQAIVEGKPTAHRHHVQRWMLALEEAKRRAQECEGANR